MNLEEGISVKVKGQRGIVMIPQRAYQIMVQCGKGTVVNETHYSLNNVLLEDGTTVAVGEDDIEEIEGSSEC